MSEPSRLAGLLGGLSLAADAANGFPPEKVLRTAILAVGLGREGGHGEEVLREIYYVALLRFLGCTAFAHEEAHVYGAGDDIAVRRTMGFVDPARPGAALRQIVSGVATHAAGLERVRAVARLLGDGKAVAQHAHAQCEASAKLAELAGFSAASRASLAFVCERFDGEGAPGRVRGESIALAARHLHVADVAEIAHHRADAAAALAEVRARSGGQLDPALASAFARCGPSLLSSLEVPSAWDLFLAVEPLPHVLADEARFDGVALAFAHFADMKSSYTLGHSIGVAELAVSAGRAAGLDAGELTRLRRAGLLHDIGRVSVENGVWDKPCALTRAEWERVRLHAYHTERIVAQASAPIATIASAAHERADGAGYHRAVPRAMITRSARILAVADAYRAMREVRAHRPALDAATASKLLREDVRAGRLDADAVGWVLDAASGVAPRARTVRPAGLSEREVEVLCLLARGKSNKEIAGSLGISPRTVQHHVEHVYDKVNVSSRAAAALFATEHGLLDP